MARCTTATCSAGEREVNDGGQLVFARDANNVVTGEYGYYPGGDQPMSIRLPSRRTGVFITDPQLRGTVRAIADANGQATNVEFKTYTISPWGEVAADTGTQTRLRLAGQQYDQGSRLYYMRARYYDPQLGRFLSEDPIGISGGLNLYAYAGNDPVNASDPSGMLTCAPHAYTVPVTTVSSAGKMFSADTAWDQARGVGLDCWGDDDGGGGSVPGLVGGGGGGPAGAQTLGPAPGPSCKQLFTRFSTNAVIDAAVGGLSEIVRGAEAIAHANALLRAGVEKMADARTLLGEGNSALAAVTEATGLKMFMNGGALGAERLGGERLVGGGVAGSIHSFVTAQSFLELAISFIPYGATAVSGYEWVTRCVLK